MSDVQDSASRRDTVHHGALHQLRHDHRAAHAEAAGALDQARRSALLRIGLLRTSGKFGNPITRMTSVKFGIPTTRMRTDFN